ncbi:MAG TPA: hypothetical protein VLZ54_04965 [Arenibacter sp.]|nr:hypothetical protein [Arenibacter sp.]
MAKQVFNSFEEIDYRLKVLRLQREIEMEQVKLHFKGAKSNLLPNALMGGVGKWTKGLLISFIANKILRRFR